jgi:hypothetical protein
VHDTRLVARDLVRLVEAGREDDHAVPAGTRRAAVPLTFISPPPRPRRSCTSRTARRFRRRRRWPTRAPGCRRRPSGRASGRGGSST